MIKSLKNLNYDARNGSKDCVIKLEVVGFKYLMDGRYLVTIRDIAVVEEVVTIPPVKLINAVPGQEAPKEETKIVEKDVPIVLRDLIFTKPEIDGLFSSVGRSILPSESFTEKFNELIDMSLLTITQMDPIYGSESADWVII